jgi:hypothetical protein
MDISLHRASRLDFLSSRLLLYWVSFPGLLTSLLAQVVSSKIIASQKYFIIQFIGYYTLAY